LNNAASWTPCHADVGVGHKRIVNIVLPVAPATSVTAIRLNVHTHFAMLDQVPKIKAIEVFDWASKAHCV